MQVNNNLCTANGFNNINNYDPTLSHYISKSSIPSTSWFIDNSAISMVSYVGIAATGALIKFALNSNDKDPLYPLSIAVDECLGSADNGVYYYNLASPCQF